MMIDCVKCYLKPMRTEDIPKICELIRNDYAKMLSDDFGNDYDPSKIISMLQESVSSKNAKKLYYLAWTKRKHTLIGFATLTKFNWIKGSAEISVLIDEKYHYIGYGPLITKYLINYCFDELNLIKVSMSIRSDNFRIPERTQYQLVKNPDNYDYYYQEILKDEEFFSF